MQVSVETEVLIARPRATVFAYASDPENAPFWYANIKSVKWQTPKPLALGSRITFVAKFLGRDLAYTYEIAALDIGERLVMRTTEGPFPMETTYRGEEAYDRSTRMRLRNRGEPRGFSVLFAPFMTHAIRSA